MLKYFIKQLKVGGFLKPRVVFDETCTCRNLMVKHVRVAS